MPRRTLLIIATLGFAAMGAFAAAPVPVDLLVNGVSAPLAIERDSARFTWKLSPAGGRGVEQASYQILVSPDAAGLAAGRGASWDSGRIGSGRSAAIEYAGKPLRPATRYWWKVRVWNQAGEPGAYSEPACFDTGLGHGEWTARYVWDGTANPNNFAYFRKAFFLSGQPSLAKVYVTAHNDYILYLNGRMLGRGPARCDPYFRGQYNAYDVTDLVTTGTNVFAAIGHWQGTFLNGGVNAEPAFLLEARFDYPDGSSTRVGTDASWKMLADTAYVEANPTYFSAQGLGKKRPPARPDLPPEPTGPSALDDPQWASPAVVIREGFTTTFAYSGGAPGTNNRSAIQFDSRREPSGWRTAGFDDSSWAPATVVDRSDYHLYAQLAPAENEQAELAPVSVTSVDGAWVVDFGRCINGWPKLTLHANRPGDRVRVQYFQMTGERKEAGWDHYTCSGGAETWKADFGRHTSFQVLKITGYAGELTPSDVRGIWAYCDADVAGRFHCSSELLNSIHEMCERAARQNVQQGIISVDANREQSPWTADSWLIGNVLLYNHRHTTMLDKIVWDYAVEQLPNGNFPACAPAHRSRIIPEWSMYWPMLLWEQYLFSGDEPLLRAMAPRLRRFLERMKASQDPVTKLINPPGWRISEYAGGAMPNGGYNIATACQYYENLRIGSRIFSLLGHPTESAEYLRQAEEVKAGINGNLFNGEFYLARTDRKEMFPLASAWALRFNIVPESVKSKVVAAVVNAGTPNLGGYGGDAFYNGMLNAGAGEFVVDDLVRYRRMLEENKANWESFPAGRRGANGEANAVVNGEVNHAWTAYPGYIFPRYILGIRPTSGGFATFDVRPETGGLSFAEGAVPTVKGLITTRWEKGANGRFSLSVDVPPNTRASIWVPRPTDGACTVLESGKVLWPARNAVGVAGVLSVQDEETSVKCVVGAGEYRFVVMPAKAP